MMTVNYRKATKCGASSKSEHHLPNGSQLQPPLLVPVREAARLLSVSTWQIRRLVRRGSLGVKKLSKTHWLITSRSILAFASEIGR
jgi:hypothetical protein